MNPPLISPLRRPLGIIGEVAVGRKRGELLALDGGEAKQVRSRAGHHALRRQPRQQVVDIVLQAQRRVRAGDTPQPARVVSHVSRWLTQHRRSYTAGAAPAYPRDRDTPQI
eukprot:204514-Prorocentrum_minimum.AAC.1